MKAVDSARILRGLSKTELARRSLLRPENVRRLLTDDAVNATLSTVLNMLRPLNLGLNVAVLSTPPKTPSSDVLKGQLAYYGAALYGSRVDPKMVPLPEVVLVDGLVLAQESASVARTLPLAFWKTHKRLDFDRLLKEGELRGQSRALGFFLDLTTLLSKDSVFEKASSRLHVRTLSRPKQFFNPTTRRERLMAETRTPDVARKWGFRMNMDMESFESMFAKGAK